MKITNFFLALCTGLLSLSVCAMQQEQPQDFVRLCWTLDHRVINQNIANQDFDIIDHDITAAQRLVQRLRGQIRPELDRRQQTAEFHTVSPVIDAFLGQLDSKFAQMHDALNDLRHYDAELDGDSNVACTKLMGLALNVKIALTKFFRIVNQQPFNRNPRAPTFAQCLQQAPIAKQFELAQIAGSCYQRWFLNGAQQAPQPAAAPANTWRNFLMDLYMQWLIKLENTDLLIDNLADYLAPDNAHVANPLQQGQQAIPAAAQYVQNVQGGLQRIAQIGHQIDGQLAHYEANAENIQAGLANPFTRDQRLGPQEFREWLQRKAQAWNDAAAAAAAQQARPAQQPNPERH